MNILSFDIEEWFHIKFNKEFNIETNWGNYEQRIEENTSIILDILQENNIKSTFFCLGWVARQYPNIIKKIHKAGHDIGSHSDVHNLVIQQNYKEFEFDLKHSIDSLSQITGSKITMFRAPAFSIGKNNLWAFEILAQNNVEVDCSVFPAKHHFGGFKEIGISTPFNLLYKGYHIKELPMSTYKIFGKSFVITGGGYFRLFPYFLINNYLKKSTYNITYFHPRDFDRNQPMLEDLSMIRKIKSYFGLKHSLPKFIRLIKEHDFISISEAVNLINWEKQRIIEV